MRIHRFISQAIRLQAFGVLCAWTLIAQPSMVSSQAAGTASGGRGVTGQEAGRGQSGAIDIPVAPGVTFVLAVHAPEAAAAGSRIALGDYEMVVALTGVDSTALTLQTRIEAQDESKNALLVNIERRVSIADLAAARLQILGFHTNDPGTIEGATALGPSLAVMRDLKRDGRATYAVQNFRHLSTSRGTLTRASPGPVPFPMIVNGRRVALPAIHVTGQLAYGENVRPWEMYLLDHPRHPLTLRYAVGGVGARVPFRAETTREIVRIDFATRDVDLEAALDKDCRVEVPGLYFDFDRATLNPQSSRALTSIADLLARHAAWRLAIEGHTDNVGTDAYNQDLSQRRAAAVKDALVRDHSMSPDRLTTAGFGAKRPKETNDTIAGRARNRRVELVRECTPP
jgi:outer membrane protein OmpA-like peptidoglycan-associated protein